MRLTPIALAALLMAGTAHAAPTPEQVAAAALKAAPVWDGHNDVPEQLRERYHDVIANFDFADTTGTADPAAKKGPMHTDLARLAMPVLVAVGDRDEVAGSPERLAALIPGAAVLVIPGRDHMQATGDKAYKQGVLAFLKARA